MHNTEHPLQEPWKAISAAAIHSEPPVPAEWDVEDLLTADDGPACWFGDSGSYKSYLALHVAWCISTGTPVFGKFAARLRERVLYINMDAGGRSFKRRVCQLAPSDNLYIVNAEYWDKSKFERLLADHPAGFRALD